MPASFVVNPAASMPVFFASDAEADAYVAANPAAERILRSQVESSLRDAADFAIDDDTAEPDGI